MRMPRVIVAAALVVAVALPVQAARSPKDSYDQALARERAVAAKASKPSAVELRRLSASFEGVARRHPTSGYADNALLKAADLAAQAHERSGQEADRARAAKLYKWLATEYPSSSLASRARAAFKALDAPEKSSRSAASTASPAADVGPAPTRRAADLKPPAESERRAPTRPVASAGVGAPLVTAPGPPPADAPPPLMSGGAAPTISAAASAVPRVREIRRAVLPELVRVTIELDGEVPYRHERIDGPARLFFDLKAGATTTLQDTVLTWPDDVVRQVRLGRQPQNTTRVVLDLDGVARYSVFTLYNPFRVVVDLERAVGKRAGLLPSAPAPTITPEPATPASPSLPAPAPAVPLDARTLTPEPVTPAPQASAAPNARDRAVAQMTVPSEQVIESREIDLQVDPIRLPAAPAPVVVRAGGPAAGTSAAETKALADNPAGAATKAVRAVAGRAGRNASRPPSGEPSASAGGAAPSGPLPPASPPTAPVPSPVPPAEATSAANTAPAAVADASQPSGPPAPKAPLANSNGTFSLARQLGLGISRIVIDPGHGGHDPGALGKNLTEAELVLDVALRLERLLLKQPGVEVVLTRRDDRFVPLEERTALANREKADLFLSIHANASRNANARGVETYFLNFASTPDAEAVAARENSASGRTMHNLPDIVRAIALNNKLDESRDFAGMVQDALVKRLTPQNRQLRNLGVKQAPFVVLIGAGMPSVLAEISFLTNAQEAQLLRGTAYRQRIAEALHDAVVRYQKSLKSSVGTVALQ